MTTPAQPTQPPKKEAPTPPVAPPTASPLPLKVEPPPQTATTSSPVTEPPKEAPAPIDPEQQKADLRRTIMESYAQLMELEKGKTPEKTDQLLELAKPALDRMRQFDVVLAYDVRAWSATGEIIRVDDCCTLKFFTEPSKIAESPRSFEALIYTQLFRPLLNSMQGHLNSAVVNDNPIPAEPLFGKNERNPALPVPKAGSSSFLADSP